MTNLRDRRPRDIADSLHRAARELFLTKGYQATTVQDIIDRSGTSKGSFYHHFDSKLAAFLSLTRDALGEALSRFEAAPAGEALQTLDRLLYEAMLLNPSALPFLRQLAAIIQDEEGQFVLSVVRSETTRLFMPALSALTDRLVAEDKAFVSNPALLPLALDAQAALWESGLLLSRQRPLPRAEAMDLLMAGRFHINRVLNLPYEWPRIISAKNYLAYLEALSMR